MASNLMQFYKSPQGAWSAVGIPAPKTFTGVPSLQGDRSVYVRASDGHLGQYYHNGDGWEWYDITDHAGGWTIIGSPAVAGGRSVFARRDDNHLIQFYFDENSHWHQFDITDLAGDGWQIIGDPAPWGDRAVWAKRDDNHLVQFWFNTDGNWEHWDITDRSGGRTIGGDPVPNDQQILARDGAGHLAGFFMGPDEQWYSYGHAGQDPDADLIEGNPTRSKLGIFARSSSRTAHLMKYYYDQMNETMASQPFSEILDRENSFHDPVAVDDAVYVTDYTGHFWEIRGGGAGADLSQRTQNPEWRVLTQGRCAVRFAPDGSRFLYARGDYEHKTSGEVSLTLRPTNRLKSDYAAPATTDPRVRDDAVIHKVHNPSDVKFDLAHRPGVASTGFETLHPQQVTFRWRGIPLKEGSWEAHYDPGMFGASPPDQLYARISWRAPG